MFLLAHRHNMKMRHYSNGFAICLLLQGVNIWHRGGFTTHVRELGV